MSNWLAIAAVTTTLSTLIERSILSSPDPDLNDIRLTTQSPDRARGTITNNQVNVFLYQTLPNAALRNMDMPSQVRPNETGLPPLALNLHYLITVYGRDNDDIFAHRLLGLTMSILHDHPLLGAEEIKAFTEHALPLSDLHLQTERIRFTPLFLSAEETSKMWTGFQAQYRLSAAYEATVILIESTRGARTPLPVLTRGRDDRGVTAQANLIPPFPTLESLEIGDVRSSVFLGDVLVLHGHQLAGDPIQVQFHHPRVLEALAPQELREHTDTAIRLKLPDPGDPTDPNAPTAHWPPGFYTVAATITQQRPADRPTDPPQPLQTNDLPLMLAPRITVPPNPIRRLPGDGLLLLTLQCSPLVWPDQRVALLLGEREILARPHSAKTGTLEFDITGVPAGTYFVRLRVDGVDSVLLDRTVDTPRFDPLQRVTIPP